ncbi:MAG TPA: YsnF/AvaK domain-containing protein, partial [Vicinamibacteria bacterium]
YAGEAIARVEGERVYLNLSGARLRQEHDRRATDASGATRGEADVRVPVAEERLGVEKREAELGAVALRKTVTEEEQTVPVELLRERAHVERRDVADRPARASDDPFREGTVRVPLRGEEAVVSKEAVVTGEVVANKEQTTERQQVADTVRQERVEVDERHDGTLVAGEEQDRGGQIEEVEAAPGRARESADGRTARGSRAGAAGRDPGAWEQLREDIREGWDRARNE